MDGKGTAKPLDDRGYTQKELQATAIPFELMKCVRELLSYRERQALLDGTTQALCRFFECDSISITDRDDEGMYRLIAIRRTFDAPIRMIGERVPEDSLSNAVSKSKAPMVRISNGGEVTVNSWFIVPVFLGVPVLNEDKEVVGAIVLGWREDSPQDIPDRRTAFHLEMFASAYYEAWKNIRYYSDAYLKGRRIEQFRLAQELHDSIAQGLFGVELYIADLLDDAELPRQTRDHLQRISTVINAQKAELRSVIYELKTDSDESEGSFADILRTEIEQHLEKGGPQVESRVAISDEEISEDVLHAAKIIVREGLVNVRKHAQATRIYIDVGTQGGRLHLAVQDDGVGVHDSAKSGEENKDMCFGIDNLQTLASDFGGMVYLEDNESGGGAILWGSLSLKRDDE